MYHDLMYRSPRAGRASSIRAKGLRRFILARRRAA